MEGGANYGENFSGGCASGNQGGLHSNINLPVVDLTEHNEQKSSDFVICKLPTDVYNRVLKIVEKTKPKTSPKRRKKVKKISPKVPIRKSRKKGTWSKEEDDILLEIVQRLGPKKWPNIAGYMEGRNGKQCRERYLNHLDPKIDHREWTDEEDDIIIESHNQFGNQWAKISRKLKGRPANMIKNRWNSTLFKISAKRKGLGTPPRRSKKRKRKDKPKPLIGASHTFGPGGKTFRYPLPQSFDDMDDPFSFRPPNSTESTPHEMSLFPPPKKRAKTNDDSMTPMSSGMSPDMNPFPSPGNLLNSSGGIDDTFGDLMAKTIKEEGRKEDDDYTVSLDQKLGLGDGDHSKNRQYKKKNDDFETDYGMDLGAPSQMSLNLWNDQKRGKNI